MAKNEKKIEPATPVESKPRKKFAKYFDKPSLTQQQFAKECDINKILERHAAQGTLADLIAQGANSSSGRNYGDFSDAMDYQESLNTVIHAQEQFESLPANVRERFGNNPASFLAFVNDPKNAEEAGKLGLLQEKKKSDLEANMEALRDLAKASQPKQGESEPKK